MLLGVSISQIAGILPSDQLRGSKDNVVIYTTAKDCVYCVKIPKRDQNICKNKIEDLFRYEYQTTHPVFKSSLKKFEFNLKVDVQNPYFFS